MFRICGANCAVLRSRKAGLAESLKDILHFGFSFDSTVMRVDTRGNLQCSAGRSARMRTADAVLHCTSIHSLVAGNRTAHVEVIDWHMTPFRSHMIFLHVFQLKAHTRWLISGWQLPREQIPKYRLNRRFKFCNAEVHSERISIGDFAVSLKWLFWVIVC